jgi:pimeloyl-ACP methyl ester carboxylesterase
MPLLAEKFEMVALDLPGQGDSDRPQTGYDTEALASKVHCLLQQLGTARYFLAAHEGAPGSRSLTHPFLATN